MFHKPLKPRKTQVATRLGSISPKKVNCHMNIAAMFMHESVKGYHRQINSINGRSEILYGKKFSGKHVLNEHKTFRRLPERLMNVQFTSYI